MDKRFCYGWDHTARSLSLAKGSVKMCTWVLFLAREFSNPGMITWRITNQSDAWVQSLIRDGLLDLETKRSICATDSIRCGDGTRSTKCMNSLVIHVLPSELKRPKCLERR